MFSPRIALVGALSGAATVALATALAMPAYAAPTSPGCLAAENTLNAAQVNLQAAENTLATDQTTGATVAKINTDKAVVSQYAAIVSQDQAAVNIQCGTSTTPGSVGNPFPHPHPWPTPTPTPGPVGLPLLNCTQLAARGIHDIPASSAWYRTALDANVDGIGCETNLNTYRVVNGQKCHLIDGQWVPVTTVTAPCTACSSTAPPPVIYQSPPVTVPAPVIQGAPVYVPGPVVSVPNTSAGINTGDGSTADDPITITVDLGDILSATPLPTLPTLPKV